jgi:predicted ATPase with chaperone activity
MDLSARSTRSLQAVSSTIADLADESEVSCAHLSEALQYRPLDDEQF